jgi:predicted secreted Zn-dependent protease
MTVHRSLGVLGVAVVVASACSGTEESRPGSKTRSTPTTSAETSITSTTTASPRRLLARGCHPGKLPTRMDVVVRCRSYSVTGSTLTELARQLDRGVFDPNDETYHAAFARWRVDWRYRYAASAEGCTLTSATVSVLLAFRVPEWHAPRYVDRAMVKTWNRFFAALWRHERGHVRNGLEAAGAIEQMLQAAGPFSTCREVEAAVDAAAERLLDRSRGRDRAYDERTEHGLSQGAVLLP